MTTGTTDLTIKSGFKTPIVEIPIPLLAVPYAAPKSKVDDYALKSPNLVAGPKTGEK